MSGRGQREHFRGRLAAGEAKVARYAVDNDLGTALVHTKREAMFAAQRLTDATLLDRRTGLYLDPATGLPDADLNPKGK